MSEISSKRRKVDVESRSGPSSEYTAPKAVCNLFTQKFSPIINTFSFVDKTLFIKTFLEANNNVVVLLAPRKFGKSTNMDMVKEFLSGNKKLFECHKLKICEEEREFFAQNCKENPVIHTDFKNLAGLTSNGFLQALRGVIQKTYDDHSYLVKKCGDNWAWSKEDMVHNSGFFVERFVKYWLKPETLSESDVVWGFYRLSKCLHAHYEKTVYVLIDEYDAPIMNAILKTSINDRELTETVHLISQMMSNFLNDNEYVERALVNATVQLAQVLSADNMVHYAFLDNSAFAPFLGFTASEVKNLFNRDEFRTLGNDENIKRWYNGYHVLDTNRTIYSTYSILKYLQQNKENNQKVFESNWVDSEYITKMKELFANREIRRIIETLLDDEEVRITKFEKPSTYDIVDFKKMVQDGSRDPRFGKTHMFIQFLVDNGYLTVTRDSHLLRVPNMEMKTLLLQNCYDTNFLKEKYHLNSNKIKAYVLAVQSVLEDLDKDSFNGFAKAVSELFDGIRMPVKEDEVHYILFTLIFNVRMFIRHSDLVVRRVKSKITREWPARLDIMAVLRNVGMIIEVKFDTQSADAALSQIKTCGYPAVFEDEYKEVTNKIYVGLHVDRARTVTLCCSTDDFSNRLTITSSSVSTQ